MIYTILFTVLGIAAIATHIRLNTLILKLTERDRDVELLGKGFMGGLESQSKSISGIVDVCKSHGTTLHNTIQANTIFLEKQTEANTNIAEYCNYINCKIELEKGLRNEDFRLVSEMEKRIEKYESENFAEVI